MSVYAHVPPYGQWFKSKLKPSIYYVHYELMCMYVLMCPHVGIGCRNSHYLQYMLSTVNSPMCMYVPIFPHVAKGLIHNYNLWEMWIMNSCVCMYPCVPMWVLVGDTAIIFNTCCTLWTHVYVCAHFPLFGQWFDTQLQPLRLVVHCVLMCLYMPMCPHMEWFE